MAASITDSLADLVGHLNDGVDFYLAAAGKVSDPLSDFFKRMSLLKRRIADDLNAEIIAQGGEARLTGSLLGSMRTSFTEMLAKLSDHTAREYISQLEDHEDRILADFREALLADPSVRVRELALLHFPEVEKMHADMRRLKAAVTTAKPGHGDD